MIYYGKKVTIVTVGATVTKFTMEGYGSTVYSARWAHPDDMHHTSPSTVQNVVNDKGWLYLSETWVQAKGVFNSSDPKYPTYLPGRNPIYYALTGHVTGVKIQFVLPEIDDETVLEVDVNERLAISPRVGESPDGITELSFEFGSRDVIGLSEGYLLSQGVNVDVTTLESSADRAARLRDLIIEDARHRGDLDRYLLEGVTADFLTRVAQLFPVIQAVAACIPQGSESIEDRLERELRRRLYGGKP